MDYKAIVVRRNEEVKQTKAEPLEVKERKAEPLEMEQAFPYMAWDSRSWAKVGSYRGNTDGGSAC